jgi:hypothetical protein
MAEKLAEYIAEISILLLILLVFISIVFRTSPLEAYEGNTSIPFTVMVTNNPVFKMAVSELESYYSYRISTEMDVKFLGDMDKESSQMGYVEILPIISFKGKNVPANMLIGSESRQTLIVDKKTESATFRLSAQDIYSRIPPMIKNGRKSEYIGELKIYQAVKLEIPERSNVTITLNKLKWDNLEQTLVQDNFRKKCSAVFEVRCSDQKKVSQDFSDCSSSNECKKIFPLCSDEISLEVNEMNCDTGSVYIYADIRKLAEKGTYHEVGEKVDVSFWKYSSCVQNYINSYPDLIAKCSRDYLGKKLFIIPPTDELSPYAGLPRGAGEPYGTESYLP